MDDAGLTKRIAELSPKAIDDFSRRCIEGARRVLTDTENPLRVNLFSAAMRILFEHMMDTLAPVDAVVRTRWFNSAQETTTSATEAPPELNKASRPTRAQRIIYAIQGGLTESFVTQELQIDPSPLRKRLLSAVDECSKHVHGREATVVADHGEQDAIAAATVSAVESLLETVRDCRDALLRPIAESLDEAAVMALLTDTLESVDELATHYSLDNVYVHDTKVLTIGAQTITYQSTGKVYVVLQYGSNSDLRNDMGAEIPESFPFYCDIEVSVEEPWNLDGADTRCGVDTSKWRDDMKPDEF